MKIYKLFSSFIYKNYARKKQYQSKFELLQRFSLNAMNYGYGSNFEKSGELKSLQLVVQKLALKNNLIIFDIGANVGHYSTSLQSNFPPKSAIYSFEPSLNTFKQLQKNTISFTNIQTYQLAFGNNIGETILYSTEKNSEIASLVNLDETNEKYGNRITEKIKIDTIDNFCKEKNIDHIDFMKIDVEGFEIDVLDGAKDMLSNGKISFIQFEFGVPNIDSRTFFRDFWKRLNTSYNIYRIVENGIHPIKSYNPTLEIFLTSNFLAEKK